MATSSTAVKLTLNALATKWPADPLRPTLQFGAALKAASERAFAGGELNGEKLVKARQMAEAGERLLQNRALKAYPMSEKTLNPPSFPQHYIRLQAALQKANEAAAAKGKDAQGAGGKGFLGGLKALFGR